MNMKKSSLFLLIATATIITGCTTSVTVSYLKSAQYDIAQYTNIAIASTTVGNNVPVFIDKKVDIDYDDVDTYMYSGYNRSIPDDVAEEFASDLTQKFQESGYFKVYGPTVTDPFLAALSYTGQYPLDSLAAKGIDALLVSNVKFLDKEEKIKVGDEILKKNPDYATDGGDEYEETGERYLTVVQTATLGITYTLISTHTGTVIASESYRDSKVDTTSLGLIFEEETDLDDMDSLYYDLEEDFVSDISSDLIPTLVYTNVTLMDNKPKDSLVSEAYGLANKGSLKQAYGLFYAEWNRAKHLPSGYNASLILEAMGEREEAYTLMSEVSQTYPSEKVLAEMKRMKRYLTINSNAEEQLSNR